MKPAFFIIAMAVLACNNSAGSKTPSTDSTANSLNDTQHPTPPLPPAADTTTKDTTSLAGTWFLQPVLTSDTAAGKIPRLIFDLSAKKFTGNTGCNSMSGTFNYTDTSLTFNKGIVTTRMACIGYNEKAFLDNLVRTTRFKLENGMLILLFEETELSRWTRKVVPKPVSNRT